VRSIPGGDPAAARSCDPFAWVEFCIDTVNAMQVYYKTGYDGVRPETVQPFPAGLRMIAGDSKATTAQPVDVAWWTCKQNHGDQGPRSATIAGTNCRAGQLLTQAVEFPQCWDGRNLDSPDHKSHMAYGAGWPDKGCPSSHPVPLPQVTTWVHWRLPAGVDLSDAAACLGHARRTRRHREPFRLVRRMGPRHVRNRRRAVPQPVP
jgi:hypothetical protein